VQVLFKHMTYWAPYPLIISASLSFFAVLFLAYGLVADKEKYCYGAYTLFALTFLGTLMPKDMVLRTAYTMSSNLEANLAALGLIIAFLSMYVLFTRVRNAPTHYTQMLLAGVALVPLLWFHTFVWLPPYDSLVTAFYGGILLIVGYISGIKIIRIIAACALIQSQIYAAEHYFISARSELPFSVLLLLGGLSLIFIFLSYALMAVKKQDTLEDRYIIQGVNAMAFIAPFMLGRTLIVIAAHYYALLLKASSAFSSFIRHLVQGSDLLTREDLSASYSYRSYALACYYGLTGLLLIMSGFAYKKPYVRYGGLFLFFLAVIRLMVTANSLLNPLMRMVSFAILGIILIGTSFLYQRVVKYQSDKD